MGLGSDLNFARVYGFKDARHCGPLDSWEVHLLLRVALGVALQEEVGRVQEGIRAADAFVSCISPLDGTNGP